MEFVVGYGEGQASFQLAPELEVEVVVPRPLAPVEDEYRAVVEALDNPVGCPPLRALVSPQDRVVVVVSDITRLWVGSPRLVTPLLDYLNRCGILDDQVEVVFATGDHRHQTEEEHRRILGPVYGRVRCYDHDCLDPGGLVRLGVTSRGTEVWLNRRVCEADRIILTGGIGFHLLAGFGGGRKSLVPGVAGYRTIQQNHGLALGGDEGFAIHHAVQSGVLAGNPVHEDMVEGARMAGESFVLNSVPDAKGHFVYVAAGELEQAHEQGCRVAAQLFTVPVARRADLVVASGGGFPKDISLYQSVKTLDNAAYACREGGALVLVAACRDGVGQPDFARYLRMGSLEVMKEELRREFIMPGFVALRAASILRSCRVFLVSDIPPAEAETLGFAPAATVPEAVQMAERALGGFRTACVMPYGSLTFPSPGQVGEHRS